MAASWPPASAPLAGETNHPLLFGQHFLRRRQAVTHEQSLPSCRPLDILRQPRAHAALHRGNFEGGDRHNGLSLEVMTNRVLHGDVGGRLGEFVAPMPGLVDCLADALGLQRCQFALPIRAAIVERQAFSLL